MISYILPLLFLANLVLSQTCYWNDGCAYQLYSSKTPYDVVRGDIRDYQIPQNCQAVNLWSIYRHGNRNPGNSNTESVRGAASLRDEIVNSYYAGRGQLCAQDIQNLKSWQWNATLDVAQSELTGTGYEELYSIAKRLTERYPHLVYGSADEFYLRTSNTQRTVVSSMAFVHGWTEGTNVSLNVDGPFEQDFLIRPYEDCERYQKEVKGGLVLEQQLQDYFSSREYTQVISNVQSRLGITTQLTADDVYALYDICRFQRSWEPDLRSPWCAAFSHDDLVVLEYGDDVRHYFRNGHGSALNKRFGQIVLKDLYERFNSTVHGEKNEKMVAYFSHNAMMEMIISALDLFVDKEGVIQGSLRDPNRVWRSSFVGCFATSLIAVLNSCEESGRQNYRVQIFFNEKVTDVCPQEGCSWEEFQEKFEDTTLANLDFCSMETKESVEQDQPGSATVAGLTSWMLAASLASALRYS